jgi:glycosyltransferase involved in cell wall biosynthesis
MTKKKTMKLENQYPFVSICTPTFNRRPFIEIMFQCFRNQDYPKSRIEWIIVDDGTDKIKDLVDKSGIPQIKYFPIEQKMKLGKKRNYMHTLTKGEYLIYMDDDDYYPPDRISHAVEVLENNHQALCAGCSEIYVYYKHVKKMMQCGPYGPNHSTAGTFAFRRSLLEVTKYEDEASLAEEKAFLKDYTIPMAQLEPTKSILVFSHEHNSFDKKKLFDNPNVDFFKESEKTVETFIHRKNEENIKKFFMQDVDMLLKKYAPGDPVMKPDVILQMKELELEREKMIADHLNTQRKFQENGGSGHFIMERPNLPPLALSNDDIIGIVKQQQAQIDLLNKRNSDMNEIIKKMQERIVELKQELIVYQKKDVATPLQPTTTPQQQVINLATTTVTKPVIRNKSDPEVLITIF